MTHAINQKVAPNIWKTATGWRVFVRTPDPVTGKSRLTPKRFKDDGRPEADQIEDLKIFRDAAQLEARRLRRNSRHTARVLARQPRTFADDAAAYLALETVQAMPSYSTRQNEISKWVTAIGKRVRATITAGELDQQLQRWRNAGYSAASVNKFRTALMALFTTLDGRSAANPVKETRLFEEAPLTARGQSYDVLERILDAVPAGTARARLEVMAWTGMEPLQVQRLTAAHLSIAERWYISPQRGKGNRRRAQPRPVLRKPMSAEAVRAFQRFVEAEAWGPFSIRAFRRQWDRAQAVVQTALRKAYRDPTFVLPHLRLKDIRHSFGTELFTQTKNEAAVAMMLDHAPGSPMTRRYTLGGVPSVLRGHMDAFRGRGQGA